MGTHEHELEIELLLQHRAWLRALAARLVGPGLADDLAQETWVAALRRPPDPARPAKPWLAAVAKRLALRLRGRTETGAPGPEGESPSTDELLERVELETRLAREVARLAEPFRRTVLLRYHAGLSAAEIARRDGVPAGTVRWRLKRGLDELRGRLDREFGDRQSWAALLAALAGVEGAAGGAVAGWVKVAGVAALAAALVAGGARWLAEVEGPEAASPLGRGETQLAAAPAPEAELSAEAGAAPGGPRREVEGRSPAAAQAAARGLSFEIIEWDGKPGADMLVALRRATGFVAGAPEAARTDASGRVAFPDAEGLVKVVVERSGKPCQLELEADGLEHRLELPRGAVVSGSVLVGGEVPVEPVMLELYRAEELGSRTDNQAMRLNSLFDENPTLRTTTDAQGRFAFVGLEEDWQGILRPARGYVRRGKAGYESPLEQRAIFLAAPTDGIELELDRVPSLRGRVVDQHGSEPVPYASLTVYPTAADGMCIPHGAGADFEGRFEVFPEGSDWRSVQVEIIAPGNLGRAEYSFAGVDLAPDGNLGDLRLGMGRTVTLHVIDPAGKPIEGAVFSKWTRASDAQGELVVSGLPPGDGSIWVAARGCVGVQVAVPDGVAATDVVLPPANEVEVIVLGQNGDPLADSQVAVSTEGPAFINAQNVRSPDELARAGSAGAYEAMTFHGSGLDAPATYFFHTDSEGRVAFSSLQPEAPLRIAALASCSVPVCEERIQAPPFGERRAITLQVAEQLHTVVLRIVDQSGSGVDRAQAVLGLAARDQRTQARSLWRADVQGRVEIRRLTRRDYRIEVSKPGYLPIVREPFHLPEGELELVLERGLDVVVRVRDAAGRTMAGGRVDCEVLGERKSFKEVEDGRIDLTGLPDRPLELALSLAGATYTLHHDPRHGDAEFTVPEHGSAVVGWAAPPGIDWTEWMEVVLVPEDKALRPLEKTVYKTASGEWDFPLVLPGVYAAVLEREDDDGERQDLTQRTRIEVRAGETARVELVPLATPARR